MDRRWARKLLLVVYARIVEELNGKGCLPLELVPPKKSITCSRSFGILTGDFEHLKEALDSYLVKCGEKMLGQKLTARRNSFLMTNRFSKHPQYSNALTIELANAANSTRELRHWT